MLFGTNVSADQLQKALNLATSSGFSAASQDGWTLLTRGDLGLSGNSSDTKLTSPIDDSVGLYVLQNTNDPSQIALSFTALSLSRVKAVFESVLPVPPQYNTDYVDGFADVFAAISAKVPALSSVTVTGFSLGGIAVNQMSKAFGNYFGTTPATFIAFGSEYISDNPSVLNIGASNDWFFGNYNDYASSFVAGDSGLATFPGFGDLVFAKDSDVSAIASDSFLKSFFALESRNTEKLGTSNLYFALPSLPDVNSFTWDSHGAAHSFSSYIKPATERILASQFSSAFTSETAVVIDFSDDVVSTDPFDNVISPPPSNPVFSGSSNGKAVYLLGQEVGDRLQGSAGQDVIEAFGGDDTIYALDGNDVIVGGSGDDFINGGNGWDTAHYAVGRADASFGLVLGSVTVTTAALGTDTVANVERLEMTDGTRVLDVDAGEIGGQAYRIYQAAFARTPDEAGLSYWVKQMDAQTSFIDVARGFVASAEFASIYGAAPSATDYVARLYQNVLGREGEEGGVTYWTSQLDSGQQTKAQVLANFAESAENIAGVASSIETGFWIV